MLESHPQLFDECKIACANRQICRVDALPKRFAHVETIFLSNNNLHSVAQLARFKKLRSLSVQNNFIEDLQELLAVLAQMPLLTHLNISGNPVSKLFTFSMIVVQHVKSLRVLDGREVTPALRTKYQIQFEKHRGLLELVLNNYCEQVLLSSVNVF